jgi:competence protein ComEC
MKPDGSPLRFTLSLYPILFSYLLGVAVASCLTLSRPILLTIMVGLFCWAILVLVRSRRATFTLFWVGAFFCLGVLALQLQLQPPISHGHVSRFATRDRVVVEGILTEPPEQTVKRVRLNVNTQTMVRNGKAIRGTGKILVSLHELEQRLDYGDRIRFESRLRRPSNFNNPGGFDYQRYLAAREIWTTAFVNNPGKIARVATKQGSAFRIWIEGLRNRIRAFLDRQSTPTSGPILKALILGERGTIPKPVREDFAISGTAHVMAISGLHLGIIAFFVFRGLLWILRRSERITLKTNIFKLSALLTIPPILLYTLMAGARITTARAAIMIIVYLVSILIDRPRDLYHTLALAALVITLIDPASVLEASFQLSFMAVLAILFLFPKLNQFFRRDDILPLPHRGPIHWLVSWSRNLLLVTLAAIIGTAPLIAYHFHRLSPMGLIGNFVVIPLLGFLAIPAGLISALVSLGSIYLAIPFIRIANWIADLTVGLVHRLASLPGASFHVTTPTLLEMVLFYGLVTALPHIRRSRFARIALVGILLFGAADVGYWFFRTRFNQNLRITVVDVGHGDCAIVEFPGGKRALIDGGGFYDDSFDVGENVVAPVLWKKKIKKVDFLVLTHPDPDHLNGLKFIARTFHVRELWDSGQESDSPFFDEFMTIVRQKGIQRVSMFREDEPRVINGVTVHLLHPSRRARSQGVTPNNRSLVLRLVFGSQTFLFTGDIEREAEAELIRSGVDLRSRVIKVPHHGSRTSSTSAFLKQVRPEIALVSVGQKSFLHLPNRTVLRRYQQFGSSVFRTDQHGAITLETDGKTLTVKTFRNPHTEPAVPQSRGISGSKAPIPMGCVTANTGFKP